MQLPYVPLSFWETLFFLAAALALIAFGGGLVGLIWWLS